MAAFYAELHLEGGPYRVVHCDYACHQATDNRGRVTTRVRYAPLELVVDVPTSDVLLSWAATPHKVLAGSVVFYLASEAIAHETIAFEAGECVRYAEHFAVGADGDGAYVCQLTIAAPSFELKAGGPAAVAAAASAIAAPVTAVAASSASLAAAATTVAAPLLDAAPTIVPSLTGVPTPGWVPEYTLNEFASTIGGAEHMQPQDVIEQLYTLFNIASAASAPGKPSLPDWKAVETLMRSSYYEDPNDGNKVKPLNGHWPPANGGYQRQTVQLKQGDAFDRFQGFMANKKPDPSDPTKTVPLEVGDEFDVTFTGSFLSPMGTVADPTRQSFASRALDQPEEKYLFAYDVEILKDVPLDDVAGEVAHVIPWYGQPGGGTQMRLQFPDDWYRKEWQQMQSEGYARVTLTSSPSGDYEVIPPTRARKIK